MTIKQKKNNCNSSNRRDHSRNRRSGKDGSLSCGRDECGVRFLETIPMIQNVADIETVQLFNVDSNEMDEEKWITLANQLNELAARPISMELWSHMEQIPWMRPHIF